MTKEEPGRHQQDARIARRGPAGARGRPRASFSKVGVFTDDLVRDMESSTIERDNEIDPLRLPARIPHEFSLYYDN